jgi:hypothetical protein
MSPHPVLTRNEAEYMHDERPLHDYAMSKAAEQQTKIEEAEARQRYALAELQATIALNKQREADKIAQATKKIEEERKKITPMEMNDANMPSDILPPPITKKAKVEDVNIQLEKPLSGKRLFYTQVITDNNI